MFCKQCGSQVSDNAKFCSKCGSDMGSETKMTSLQSASNSFDIRLVIGLIGVVMILALTVGFFLFHKYHKAVLDEPQSAENELVDYEDKSETAIKIDKELSPAAKTQELLRESGYDVKVLATSYGHSNKGVLALVKTDMGYRFAVYSYPDEKAAFIDYSSSIYNFYFNADEGMTDPLIFTMEIPDDERDKDVNAGIWEGSDHFIPVYALYDIKNGVIIPGLLSTGEETLEPSHYHSYFYETKNVNIINLVLTEMQALHEDAQKKNIDVVSIDNSLN